MDKSLVRLLAAALAVAGTLRLEAQTPVPTRQLAAVARADQNSRTAHEQLLAKARAGRIDIYFAGDSITRRWGCCDEAYRDLLANWKANFFGWNAANFAWGGDRVQNILWRLENGELDGVNPRVIVLMAGTNNLRREPSAGSDDAQVTEVVAGIREILAVMQQKAPGARIILMGITPRRDRQGGISFMPTINDINQRLATFADGEHIQFLNINDHVSDSQGKLLDGMTVDGLHLSERGYQVWADALKPIFTELLGPPAKEDHAPPPTGDPSAQRNN